MSNKKPVDYKYTYAAWAEAFMIFAKYEPDTWGHVAPEHDTIWAGPNPSLVSDEDKARLLELGWRPDESVDCFICYP